MGRQERVVDIAEIRELERHHRRPVIGGAAGLADCEAGVIQHKAQVRAVDRVGGLVTPQRAVGCGGDGSRQLEAFGAGREVCRQLAHTALEVRPLLDQRQPYAGHRVWVSAAVVDGFGQLVYVIAVGDRQDDQPVALDAIDAEHIRHLQDGSPSGFVLRQVVFRTRDLQVEFFVAVNRAVPEGAGQRVDVEMVIHETVSAGLDQQAINDRQRGEVKVASGVVGRTPEDPSIVLALSVQLLPEDLKFGFGPGVQDIVVPARRRA